MRYVRRSARQIQPLFATAGACLALGCLSAGDPPEGQHLLPDRTPAAVFFTASEADGVASNLLVAGPVRQAGPQSVPEVDLYRLAYGAEEVTPNNLNNLAPTVPNVVIGADGDPATYIPHTDSQGRLLFVQSVDGAPDFETQVARFNLATGQEEVLGPPAADSPGYLLSHSRSRVFVDSTLFDLDHATDLSPLTDAQPVFIGDDLYYGTVGSSDEIAVSSRVMRDRPGSTPEVILSVVGTLKFAAVDSDVAPELLLSWEGPSGDSPFTLLDTESLVSTSLPSEAGQTQFVSASSDGHVLMFQGSDSNREPRLLLFDWTTGNRAWLDKSSLGQAIGDFGQWRPGHDEWWTLLSTGGYPTGFAIWNEIGLRSSRSTSDLPVAVTHEPDGGNTMFTRDGRYWFSADYRLAASAVVFTVFVVSADDPTRPRVVLSPEGSVPCALWETSDGLLLAGSSAFDVNRQDIYLVDPDAGTSHVIATGGRVVALGRTRALALLNWQLSTSTGDLTLVDLATGTKTVLAQDVYNVAVDPGISADVSPDADLLAPGTIVAFLSRNRLASPYDGLWVTHLP